MFGFPISNGNSGYNDFVEKFTNNADSGFPKIQQREVFYSVKDGIWGDTTVWQTASGRVGILPTLNDDVYIRHSITHTVINNTAVYNLFITGVFNFGNTGLNMSVFGNLKCTGIFNHTSNGTIILYGSENYINTYNFNTVEPAITYARNDGIPQPIMPITHGRITMTGISEKYLVADFVQGTSSNTNLIQSTFDTRGYNVTFTTGVNFFTSTGDFIANGSTLIFQAGCTWTGIRRYEVINSIIEFRNGFSKSVSVNGTFANSVINFTTNTQNFGVSFSGAGPHNIDAIQVNIVGNIELNIAAGSTQLNMYCPFNGTTANSKLTNRADITFRNIESVASMTTGIYDFTTYANTVQYAGNYSATIPSYFTNFHNLTISGTGTKTLGVNTTLNGNLLCTSGGSLQLSTYNIDVIGTTSVAGTNSSLLKSGAGNLIFRGKLGFLNASTSNPTIDFSLGNPTVECRGGIERSDGTTFTFKTGTGAWTLTTNNQTIYNYLGSLTFDCPITIVGAINVSINSINNANVRFNEPINGTVAGSTLTNITNVWFGNSTTSMTTGTFDITTNLNNTVGYVYNGSGVIPYTTYRGLLIGGTGTKTVSGNLTVNYNLVILGGILDLTTYDLIVNGTTTFQGVTPSTFAKTGAGNMLFVGNIIQNAASAGFKIDLSGNPTVEVRNGINLSDGTISGASTSGVGQWTFSTNNQTITGSSFTTFGQNFFQCPILISGSITVTFSANASLNGILNGDNINSKLLMGASSTLTYKSATQPMVTGILDTSTNLNTWIYGLSNQDIKGGPTTLAKQVYRNLTLNGGGTKTLQGYVSVLNTYTLTAPATLALNGYTLTNP